MSSEKFLEPVSHYEDEVETVKISTEQFEEILNIQQSLLDFIAQDENESDTLDMLCRLSETLLDNAVATIMLLNQDERRLRLISAPSIAPEHRHHLDGISPGAESSSCGAAIHFKKPSYVVDTQSDERWASSRKVAKDLNICSCWSMPVFSRSGAVIGTFALSSSEHRSPTIYHDRLLKICASVVSILVERKELRRLAMVDKLTKLWNRSKLDNSLEEEREKMSCPEHQYAVMLIDIDLFKSINDNFGHNVGDHVLAELAGVLRKQVASAGVVGRWGGEEFMVILSGPNSNEAPAIAQLIRKRIERHRFKTVGTVTASIGVCVVGKKARTLEIIDDADQALYQAKGLGRNRVSVHYKNKPKKPLIIDMLDKKAINV